MSTFSLMIRPKKIKDMVPLTGKKVKGSGGLDSFFIFFSWYQTHITHVIIIDLISPSVCDLALFNLFISSAF